MTFSYFKLLIKISFTTLMLGLLSYNVNGQSITPNQDITICPSLPDSVELPNFSDVDCYASNLSSLNPQNKEIWVKLILNVDEIFLKQTKPMGLFIHGKTSSLVYLNNRFT